VIDSQALEVGKLLFDLGSGGSECNRLRLRCDGFGIGYDLLRLLNCELVFGNVWLR